MKNYLGGYARIAINLLIPIVLYAMAKGTATVVAVDSIM